MNYCRICGSKSKKIKTGFYDTKTGKLEKVDACSKNPCAHTFLGYHKWERSTGSLGNFEKFRGMYW